MIGKCPSRPFLNILDAPLFFLKDQEKNTVLNHNFRQNTEVRNKQKQQKNSKWNKNVLP